MKKLWVTGLLGAAVWGLVACSPSSTGHAQAWSPKALLETHWVDAGPTLGQLPASLDVASTGQISGHAGCNRYFGKADIGPHSLRMVQVGSTRMHCFQLKVMEAEDRFLQAITQTRSARQEQGQLLLLDEAGQVLWRFKPKG